MRRHRIVTLALSALGAALSLYGLLFVAEGRPLLGALLMLAAIGSFGLLWRLLTRAAEARRVQVAARERAFLERVRRGRG
jgi:hypothetical protein